MGDLNQLDFVLENRRRVQGPILEVGSKDHGNANDFRVHFPDLRYVGADLEPGKGVDAVCDFTGSLQAIRDRLGGMTFRTGICMSVMEHCSQPFAMARGISGHLDPGACLFLSVPWVWNMHGFPDDYWRFTPSAVRVLFPDFDVVEEASFWSTKNRGERLPLATRKMNLHEEAFFKSPDLARELRNKDLTRFSHPYYCYPVMLNMLLVKRSSPSVERALERPCVRAALDSALEAGRSSPAYRNYLDARDHVLEMLDDPKALGPANRPSAYWRDETAGMDYLLDASPLIVERLREHCYHLTGLLAYDYRGHHHHKRRPFEEKLASLRAVDGVGLTVREPPLLGGFGHDIEGGLVNVDTLKFYEALIALDRAGLLAQLRGAEGRGKVVLEIGAGWGGFAFQLRTICPEAAIMIVDLPQSLLFSCTYLRTAFPAAPFHIAAAGEDLHDLLPAAGGFLFVPHFRFGEPGFQRPDLAINMCSLQEMTTDQVRRYAGGLRDIGCPALYSLNRDRSSHNAELTAVSDVLAESYSIEEVQVLAQPYTTLGRVAPRAGSIDATRVGPCEYRHLVGRIAREG